MEFEVNKETIENLDIIIKKFVPIFKNEVTDLASLAIGLDALMKVRDQLTAQLEENSDANVPD